MSKNFDTSNIGSAAGGAQISTSRTIPSGIGGVYPPMSESESALIESFRELHASLQGFQDQLKAMQAALVLRGVLPRGYGGDVVSQVINLPQMQKIIDDRAAALAASCSTIC